jgi:ABC-type dipeptide/oligopeptide/nickel transport system permease subunit
VTTEALVPPAAADPHTESPLRRNLRSFAGNRLAVAASGVVVAFVLIAIFAPWIAPHDPYATDLFRRLQPPAWQEGGDWAYVLGCDALGRDILSRMIYGARVSIFIGATVVFVATTIGILAGLAAGYLRGWTDIVISRIVDILLAFPYLIFAIGLMAMMGPGLQNIVVALVYKEWVIPCRVVRGETLAASQIEYVEAARALGASNRHIMLREILPNILSPHGACDHPRGEPLLPRHRGAAADCLLGLDGLGRTRLHPRELVGLDLPGHRHPAAGPRHQRGEPGPA